MIAPALLSFTFSLSSELLGMLMMMEKAIEEKSLEADRRDAAFLLNWLLESFSLSATFFLFVCFTSLCCSFHPRCLYHQKEKKTHTRQELISPAANSHSRWSIFSPFQNERTEWKLWPYTWSSVKQSSWDCFQLQALYFVSVYFSAFILLYLPLFWSLHIQLSVSTQGAAAAPDEEQPVARSNPGLHSLPRGSFLPCDLSYPPL